MQEKKNRLLPILFNTEMVRAILDGQKTVTRRLIKPQPDGPLTYCFAGSCNADIGKWHNKDYTRRWTPPCHGDDILYVRETWAQVTPDVNGGTGYFMYKADYSGERLAAANGLYMWHPSIHMPKEAARIFLRVKRVSVERLQNITDKQSLLEGIEPVYLGDGEFAYAVAKPDALCSSPKVAFASLWESTIKPAERTIYGWEANPWVWVIEFERCEQPKEE